MPELLYKKGDDIYYYIKGTEWKKGKRRTTSVELFAKNTANNTINNIIDLWVNNAVLEKSIWNTDYPTEVPLIIDLQKWVYYNCKDISFTFLPEGVLVEFRLYKEIDDFINAFYKTLDKFSIFKHK
jgi:hypothetical protein